MQKKNKFIYTETKWEEEMNIKIDCGRHPLYALGCCNIACPKCGTFGFYGPRETKQEKRKYRACKFCGFWQEIDGKPYRCIHIHCKKCETYDWRLPDQHSPWKCQNGHTIMEASKWPTDDPSHSFHAIKKVIDISHIK